MLRESLRLDTGKIINFLLGAFLLGWCGWVSNTLIELRVSVGKLDAVISGNISARNQSSPQRISNGLLLVHRLEPQKHNIDE